MAADKSYGFSVFALSKGFSEVVKGLEKLGRTLDSIDRKTAKATVDVDTEKALAKVGRFARDLQSRVERAVRSLPEVDLKANASAVDRRIADIRRELAALADRRIGIDVDAGEAQARVNRLSAELDRLSRKSSNVQVKADTAAASAALAGVSAQARRLDGQRVNIAVNASDVSRAISLVGLLTAALAAASAAVGPVAAGLAALGPLALAGAQGAGAVATGLSGIGDAVKALSDVETKAAAGTATSAASRVNSAQSIANAQRQVEQAVIQADRAAITGAQQVADARQALADVYEQSANSVAAAEADLARSHTDVTMAQEGLNRAMAEGREYLEDLALSVRDAALDEREAVIKLAEAQDDLIKGQAEGRTGRDLEKLQLGVDKASLALDKARERQVDLAQESEHAARVGVEGSDRVVAAQQRVDEASRGVLNAERRLAEAREQGARDVARAQEQLSRTQQQALWSQQDAARQVEDAQRALANAYADTGNVGAASANKVAEAMANLSPEGQRFARFIAGELLPQLRRVRDQVQAGLLPGLEEGLREGSQLLPIFADGLEGAGRVVGDLAVKGAQMMTSGPWRRDFATIMDGNNRVLGNFGEVGLDVLDMIRNLTVGSLPMVERLSESAEKATEMGRAWLQAKRDTGELDEWFDQMGDSLLELIHICGQLIEAGIDISQALGPMGMVVLKVAGDVAEFLGEIAAAHPELTQLVATLAIGAAAFTKLGSMIAGATLAAGVATGGWQTLIGTVGMLSPTAIAQSAAMQRVSSGMQAAALSAGVMTESFIRKTAIVENSAAVDARAAAAGERVAATGSKVANAATKISSALPVAGAVVVGLSLAYDGLVTSSSEATQALLQGGAAAEAARAALERQNRAAQDAHINWEAAKKDPVALGQAIYDWLVPGLEQGEQKARDLYGAMTPLQQAQTDVTIATNNYALAVREHGPSSAQAAAASDRLALATDNVERETRAAEDATKDYTDKLIALQDQILASADADLRAESSRLAVERAQRSLSDAITQYGADSLEAREAENAYQETLIRAVAAVGDATRAQYAHKDAAVADQMAMRAQNDEIWRLIVAAGSNAPPALLAMAAGMSDAELKARGATIRVNELGERVLSLPGAPGQPPFEIRIGAYTGPAQEALNRFIIDNNGRKIDVVANMMTPSGVPIRQLGGGATGAVVDPMALGGIRGARLMSNKIAQVVPPNTPRLIGDRIRGREYFLPDDNTPRTMAIGSQWARDRGLRLMPMAGGGVLGGGAPPWELRSRARTGGVPGFPGLATTTPGGVDPEKTTKAFRDLADVFTGRLNPALVDAQQRLGVDTKKSVDDLTRTTTDSGALMGRTWDDLQTRLRDRALGIQAAITGMQTAHNASWMDMRTRAGVEIAQITGPQFGGLRASMDAVQGHSRFMADWVGGQYARLRGLTADPIRWSLDFPINRGLVPAWNAVQNFFALNRPMGPVPIGFHSGGTVPGSGRGDKVPALLEPGEEVMPVETATPFRRFLKALTAGQAEAVQAAGGRFARFQAGGTVERVQSFARAQHGKPYQWGAVGPSGYDCSGFQSALTNVATGKPPHQRLFSTASFARGPVAGFVPGLTSAYGIGVFQGNPGHVAGTVAGLNVEAGGSPSMTKAGPGAAGATHPQFRQHFSLPTVGGRFIPGGPNGFDTAAYLRKEFSETRRMISEIIPRYGNGNPPAGMTRFGNDAVDGASKYVSPFDRGGYARGRGWMFKDTLRPERMLSPQETEAFEELTRILGTLRGSITPRITTAAQTAAGRVEKHYLLTVYEAANNRVDLAAQFHRLELQAGIKG